MFCLLRLLLNGLHLTEVLHLPSSAGLHLVVGVFNDGSIHNIAPSGPGDGGCTGDNPPS